MFDLVRKLTQTPADFQNFERTMRVNDFRLLANRSKSGVWLSLLLMLLLSPLAFATDEGAPPRERFRC